jgi:choline dehydrogenase-like flavoprotein
MTLGVNLTQPNSSGEIELVDRTGSSKIHSRYFDDPSDLDAMVEGVFLARSLAQLSPLCDSVECETLPGEKRKSKAGVAKAVARYAQTLYHPVGSCRLGSRPDSVVDMDFTVRGTEQLWVVDASVLPRLTIGNPNAMVMTLAVMAAERINLDAS